MDDAFWSQFQLCWLYFSDWKTTSIFYSYQCLRHRLERAAAVHERTLSCRTRDDADCAHEGIGGWVETIGNQGGQSETFQNKTGSHEEKNRNDKTPLQCDT